MKRLVARALLGYYILTANIGTFRRLKSPAISRLIFPLTRYLFFGIKIIFLIFSCEQRPVSTYRGIGHLHTEPAVQKQASFFQKFIDKITSLLGCCSKCCQI
jgi:uncharacterized membrane protein YdbT with pleckstrin-like domain